MPRKIGFNITVMIRKIIKKFNRIIQINNHQKFNSKPKFFTKDIFSDKNFDIGEYTYGKPIVLFQDSGACLEIGKFCSIAQNVKIYLGGNHRTDWITTYPFNAIPEYFPESERIVGHPATRGDVRIGNDVWLGNDVSILSGVTIGNGAVIGAGSMLSSTVGSYEIWAGNPAKFIRCRFNEEEIKCLEKLKWWDWNIELIRENSNLLCSTDLSKLIRNEEEIRND